jgi:putative ABC transport system permease protein
LFFILCIALAIMSVVALEGWSTAIRHALFQDAKQLHGGDIIVRSYFPFSDQLAKHLIQLQQSEDIKLTRFYELYSMVLSSDRGDTLLAKIKAVAPDYPLYGKVDLASGQPLEKTLQKGTVVVARSLLERLQLVVGSQLIIGGQAFRIADVVVREPDRPVSIFALGPRLFITRTDLSALNLIQSGSRVRYVGYIQMADESRLDAVVDQLKQHAMKGQEQVTTYRSAHSRIKVFWDRFFLFLKLVNLFTVLVAGMGMHSALSAFFRHAAPTVAILKAIGASPQFVWIHFLMVVFIWGGFGIALGIAAGVLLQYAYPLVWGNLISLDTTPLISWDVIQEGLIMGLLVTALFSMLPLYHLKEIKPLAIIRASKKHHIDPRAVAVMLAGIILFVGSVVYWWSFESGFSIAYFIGILLFLLVIGIISQGAYALLKKISPEALSARLALKGLSRPMNATRTIFTTLTAAFTLIFSIYLLEATLTRTYDDAMPATASNIYLIDIQPYQVAALKQILGQTAEFYPVIRSRLTAINGQKINRNEELRRIGDNLAREFNLTYRHHLLPDEYYVAGDMLFAPGESLAQVSVLQKVARIGNIQLGDQLSFNIQGIPLHAKVSSIRSRNSDSFEPFFYFVFPEAILKDAPHTFFTALHLPPTKLTAIQTQIAKQFPNISVINFTDSLARFTSVLSKLGKVIRFVASFCLIAGFVIIISSFVATRLTRIKEIVYYKVLGASERLILKVYAIESAIIATVSVVMALILATVITAILALFVFDLDYQPLQLNISVIALLFIVLISMMGVMATRPMTKYKPMRYLRSQEE